MIPTTGAATCQRESRPIFCRVGMRLPPFHATDTDVDPYVGVEHLGVASVVAHQVIRGMGGNLTGFYQTRWEGLMNTSWERESVLRRSHHAILRYWVGMPDQRGGDRNRSYPIMRRSNASCPADSTSASRPTRGSCEVNTSGSRRLVTSGGLELSARSGRPTDHSSFDFVTYLRPTGC